MPFSNNFTLSDYLSSSLSHIYSSTIGYLKIAFFFLGIDYPKETFCKGIQKLKENNFSLIFFYF